MKNIKLHFRILVLDSDTKERRNLENYILSSLAEWEKINFEDTVIYHVSDEAQIASIPLAAAFNSIWINVDFPNWNRLARQLYMDNPFCYQVLYGRKIPLSHDLMRSRPIGYVILRDFHRMDSNGRFLPAVEQCYCDVHREMDIITQNYSTEDDMLSLKTRSSAYWVPCGSILYLQSNGRKTYIYMNARANLREYKEEDGLVKSADGLGEPFAYVQNIKLDEICTQLDQERFIRVHKSYMVNKQYIQGISKNKYSWILTLRDKENRTIQIPVSDPYHDAVDSALL